MNTTAIFSVILRVYPSELDIISLTLRNELSDFVITPDISFTVGQRLQVHIEDAIADFKSGNKYEIVIDNAGAVIYRGRLIVVDELTDTQNFEYTTQENGRFKFKT